MEEHIHFNRGREANAIGYFYVGDHETSISESTWLYIKQGLKKDYNNNPPIFIILEFNTPGGEVFAAQKISDALKEMDTQYNIPVVADIIIGRFRRGAMLAYSCRYITGVKDGSMGGGAGFPGRGGKLERLQKKSIPPSGPFCQPRPFFFAQIPYRGSHGR